MLHPPEGTEVDFGTGAVSLRGPSVQALQEFPAAPEEVGPIGGGCHHRSQQGTQNGHWRISYRTGRGSGEPAPASISVLKF